MQSQLQTTRAEKESIAKQLEEDYAESIARKLEEASLQYRTQLQVAEQTIKELELALSQSSDNVKNDEEDVEVLQEALDAAAARIQEAQVLIESKDAKLAEVQAKLVLLEALEIDLANAQKMAADAERRALQLEKEVVDSNNAQEAQAERIQKLEEHIAIATAQLEEYKGAQVTASNVESIKNEAQIRMQSAEERTMEANAALAAAEEKELAAVQAVRDAEQRADAAEEMLAKFKVEDQQRSKKFALVNGSFAKKERELMDRAESAELQAASLRTERDQLNAEIRLHEHITELQDTQAREAREDEKSTKEAEMMKLIERVSKQEEQIEDLRSAVQAASSLRVKAEEEKERVQQELHATQHELSDLQQALLDLEQQMNQLSSEHQELMMAESRNTHGTDALAALEEKQRLEKKLKAAEARMAVASATQDAHVVSLEKQNRELSWQVAMLTRGSTGIQTARGVPPDSVSVPMSAESHANQGGTLAAAVGVALRHRKRLIIVYLVALHILVYISLVHKMLFRIQES